MALWEGKTYKCIKTENFDEYMKALGVGMVLRKMGNSINPTIELVKNGDTYTFTTSSTFKSTVISFKDGVEFEEETADGRKVKSIITFDGPNKWTQKQGGDKPSTLVREFKGDELHLEMTIGDVKATRVYKIQ